jgi:hypothetical protein
MIREHLDAIRASLADFGLDLRKVPTFSQMTPRALAHGTLTGLHPKWVSWRQRQVSNLTSKVCGTLRPANCSQPGSIFAILLPPWPWQRWSHHAPALRRPCTGG